MSDTTLAYSLYSFGIVFREGLEALLVILALAAGARRAGQNTQVRNIYIGAGAAVVISLAMAWAVQHILGDDTGDAMEGIFQLCAAATLFYVSSRITSKSQAHRWNNFITNQMQAGLGSETASITLAGTAFLAVLREGAETIVFFQALVAGATEVEERHAVLIGLAAGAVALVAIFLVLNRLTSMIPIGKFFSVTSVLLYALAVIFTGQGIASLQEAGMVGASFVSGVPTVPMIGLYPTFQTLGAQAILLLAALPFTAFRHSFARRAETVSAHASAHRLRT
jgi:high-affinity iron transporter